MIPESQASAGTAIVPDLPLPVAMAALVFQKGSQGLTALRALDIRDPVSMGR